MIEISGDDYVSLIADVIGTLTALEKDDKGFILKIWYSNCELPFEFDDSCHFDFIQEGLRVDDGDVKYLWYDSMETIMVERK